MSTTTIPDLAEHVIATLRSHEAELRKAGIRRLSLFGSVARGDAKSESDVDLAAEFDPEASIGLFALEALEQRLAELIGRTEAADEPNFGAGPQPQISRPSDDRLATTRRPRDDR